MLTLAHPDELILGGEYMVADGFCEGQVGTCKAVHTSSFGYVWGEIELPGETRRVRWNLLAIHPQPSKPEIVTRVGVWMCPECGEQGAFAGFCDNDQHEHSVRLVYRPSFTVEQVERARDAYIEKVPEARRTVESFLKGLFDTPLLDGK